MSMTLLAVRFNHDPGSRGNALNIRKNATEFVNVPEWRRGTTGNSDDSPAAYAINETRGNPITIQAAFRTDDPAQQSAIIRAAGFLPSAGLQAWLQSMLSSVPMNPPQFWYLYNLYLQQISATLPNQNILGDSTPTLVRFKRDGTSDFITFQLPQHRISSCGVHDIEWTWQLQSPVTFAWMDFDRSRHRIYTIVDAPKPTWQQEPYHLFNTQLPWTDVLNYSCRWASGATTVDGAAERVTRAVFELGDRVIAYDCDPGGGGVGTPHYSLFEPFSGFFCTKFIERLRGLEGNGELVNCTDCATILSTFANILGCDLWQARMGFFFDLNPVISIGSRSFAMPCGDITLFGMHEVAWKNECSFNDEIFDACVQLDASGDPSRPPHVALLAANMRFSVAGVTSYRDRLSPPTPTGQSRCLPRPFTRKRRVVF